MFAALDRRIERLEPVMTVSGTCWITEAAEMIPPVVFASFLASFPECSCLAAVETNISRLPLLTNLVHLSHYAVHGALNRRCCAVRVTEQPGERHRVTA